MPVIAPALAGLKIPTVCHDGALLHYGFLDNPLAPTRGASNEGPCLSCSIDEETADAWLMIAELGGRPLWSLVKPGGFVLADYYSIPKHQLTAIAAARGLVERRLAFKCWATNEDGEPFFTMHLTKAEAHAELVEGGRLRECLCWAPTVQLCTYWGQRHPGTTVALCDTLDAAVTALLDASAPMIDGIYWDETLDPLRYSAPRVGLFQRILNLVSRTCDE